MAEVYLAKAAGPGGFEKSVCLKRILPHLARDEAFVQMFLNEARLAATLDHPNIGQIFDLGEISGNYYIAMEFIDGPNLRAALARARELDQKLPLPEILRVVSLAAGGLHYAHNMTDASGAPMGLVHRDVSPDNILLHKNGSVKVVDFGIAKAAGGSSSGGGRTHTGTLKGKIAYMSPEQLRGEPLDRRSDVFALGVVLYELVTGAKPFEGPSEVATLNIILTQEPRPIAELRSDAPSELWEIVRRALAKDRDARTPDCATLQAELEALLVSMGTLVTASSIAQVVGKFAPPDTSTPTPLGGTLSMDEVFGGGATADMRAAAPPRTPRPSPMEASVADLHRAPPPAPAASHGISGGIIAAGALVMVVAMGGAFAVVRGFGPNDTAQVETSHAAPPVEVVAAAPVAVSPGPVALTVPPVTLVPSQPIATPLVKKHVAQEHAETPPVTPPVDKREAPPESPKQVVINLKPPEPTPTQTVSPIKVARVDGTLVLQVVPWAHVEVDGAQQDDAPTTLRLSAGVHHVRLWNDELGKERLRTVDVPAGGKETLKEVLSD